MTNTIHTSAPHAARTSPGFGMLAQLLTSWKRWPMFWLASVLLGALTLMAIFAPFLGTIGPNDLSPIDRLQGFSSEFWFGTDLLGRDVYSRIVYGARISLFVGFSVAALSSAAGVVIGLLSGAHRMADLVVMRIVDGLMSIPAILLAVALVALLGASVQNVIIALTITETPRVVRLMRSVVLSAREEPYVEAAVTSGTRSLTILARHILPNTFAPILVQTSYIFASAMIAEASLSFLGIGVPPEIPSWGGMMSDARILWQAHPRIVFIPAIFLSIAVLCVNMLGDSLRDMLDPRLERKW